MNRRDALRAVGSVGVVAFAGCTRIGSRTITNPDEELTDDGDVNLNFLTENGDKVATLTVMPGRQRYPGHAGAELPVKIAITHGKQTKIESLRLDLRAPASPTGAGAPAEIAFTTPFAQPHPSIKLYKNPDDVSTILDIPETGEQGEGNMVLDFLLLGLRDETVELAVDVAIEMKEKGALGRDYTLEGLSLVPLPEETE